MPVVIRRQPSLDLRKAARAARDAAFDYDLESFPSLAEGAIGALEQLPTTPRKQPRGRHSLRLSTSSPALRQGYLSDEEQPSPTTAGDADSASRCSDDLPGSRMSMARAMTDEPETLTRRNPDIIAADAAAIETSDEEEEDEEADLSPPRTVTAAALAIAVPILAVGRPRLVSISALAPPQKRQTPVNARPTARLAASLAIMRRFRAPTLVETVSPVPSPPLEDDNADAASYRTAASSAGSQSRRLAGIPDRVDSLTPSVHSRVGSPASEGSSSSISEAEPTTAEPVVHETAAHKEESEPIFRDVAVASGPIKASHFHQQPYEPEPPPAVPRRRNRSLAVPASTRSSFVENFDLQPASYADYDPFALSPPTLHGGDAAADGMAPPESPRLRRWKNVGMSVGLGMHLGPRTMNKLQRKHSRRWGMTGVPADAVRV